ncbi:hypothetical protein TSAR_006510 [Trichomalopsis sarcophagae]|uniref:Uncharacterized protein n=1 Tax=Trichomalopsis sarcophagae TaxID=543379 RepID=A0A232EZD1_9HYME|nr:hypothetical protein TSAR_006510 [Trichomalopsis sarcophagae]
MTCAISLVSKCTFYQNNHLPIYYLVPDQGYTSMHRNARCNVADHVYKLITTNHVTSFLRALKVPSIRLRCSWYCRKLE